MRRSRLIFDVFQIASVALLFVYLFSRRGPWDAQRDLGMALILIGLLGIAIARFQLGGSFSIVPQARQLVTHGLYSRIRNPIYFFGTILFAGLIIFLHRPILWILFVVMVILQMIRARREAQVLEAAFGDAYREYRRKTWF